MPRLEVVRAEQHTYIRHIQVGYLECNVPKRRRANQQFGEPVHMKRQIILIDTMGGAGRIVRQRRRGHAKGGSGRGGYYCGARTPIDQCGHRMLVDLDMQGHPIGLKMHEWNGVMRDLPGEGIAGTMLHPP